MMIDCVHYQGGSRQTEGISLADAARLSRDGAGFVWLTVREATRAELDELRALFDLPMLAVEDALAGHQRPKLEEYGRSAFVVVKTLQLRPAAKELDVGELSVFLGSRHVIVVDGSGSDLVADARARLDQRPEVAVLGPMAGLWALLDAVIDDGEHVVDRLGDELDHIEQAVFEGERDQSQPIYVEHRMAERLARIVHPMLATFDALERGEPVACPDALRPLLREVGHHARRLSEETVMLASSLDGLLNANLARVTVRQNVIVQKVSAWAALAAVPTVVTGIYGMNFRHFPELDWRFGYPSAVVVMVLAVIALRWNFRRAGWM